MSTPQLDHETVSRVKREALEAFISELPEYPDAYAFAEKYMSRNYPPPPPKKVRAEIQTIAGVWALGSDAEAWYWRSSVASSGCLPCEVIAEMHALQQRADSDGMIEEGLDAPTPAKTEARDEGASIAGLDTSRRNAAPAPTLGTPERPITSEELETVDIICLQQHDSYVKANRIYALRKALRAIGLEVEE